MTTWMAVFGVGLGSYLMRALPLFSTALVAPSAAVQRTIRHAGLATLTGGGQTIGYQVQSSGDLVNWADVSSGGSVIYDATHGEFRYLTAPNPGGRAYYRYRVTWSP